MLRSNKGNIIAVRVDDSMKRNLEEASRKTSTSVSNLMRLCVKAELDNIKERYGQAAGR